MAKPLHKLRIDPQQRIFLDDKPLKGVQALQLTMDIRNPHLAIVNIVMAIPSPDLVHLQADITVEQPKIEEAKTEETK